MLAEAVPALSISADDQDSLWCTLIEPETPMEREHVKSRRGLESEMRRLDAIVHKLQEPPKPVQQEPVQQLSAAPYTDEYLERAMPNTDLATARASSDTLPTSPKRQVIQEPCVVSLTIGS